MDHQYNHQWRQGPPQANMCPVCYIPHFPFCPQHPHYPLPSPSFPLPPPDYPRPGFSPYQPPLPPMAPHHRPYVGNASDGFGDPRSWHGNQNFRYGHNADNGYAVGGEADRSYKRPRVDEIAPPPSSALSDDERRLKLIREHGGGASLGGFDNETNRHMQNNGPSSRMNEFGSEDKSFEQSAIYKHENAHNNPQIHNINSVPAKEHHFSNVTNRPPGNSYQDPHHDKDGSYNQFHNRQQHPRHPQQNGYQGPAGYHLPRPFGNNGYQPPLPVSPPPPVPLEPPGIRSSDFKPGSSPGQASISWQPTSEVHSFNQTYYQNNPPMHGSAAFVTKVSPFQFSYILICLFELAL